MTRDVKHRVPAFRKQKATPRTGLIILGGFILIAIIVAAAQSLGRSSVPPTTQSNAPISFLSQNTIPPAPEVTFFLTLPEGEKKIAEQEISWAMREKGLGKLPVAGQFFLQVGAFADLEMADRMKARLEKTVRLKPKMEKVRLEYATWYRIKLGPYRTIPDADQVRHFLRERNMDSIIQKADD